jgi:hypothetical protein
MEWTGSLTVEILIATVSSPGVTESASTGEGGNPMPDTKSHDEVEVVEVTREEGRAMLDRAAREALNISGKEFLAKWDAGEYEETDDPAVTRVAMLIPFAR